MALLMASIFCDAQIIESSEAFNRVISFAPFAKRNLRVIPNGISEEFLQKATNCPYYEREKVILTVAGVQRYKSLEYLIQAFSILKDRYADYKLRIVGPIIDKIYFQELNKLIERLQLSGKVIFTGKISDEDLIKEYLTAKVFCLPSSIESFSIARLEAMALGLPIVTTKTGGSEIVKGAGFVVDIGDINGLAKALDALLKDDALWCEMSNKAKTIAKQMTWENLVRKILRLLT
jgi:glycosyltransferase involved in cell wall biosynthesis